MCPFSSASKDDKLYVTLRPIGHHTPNKVTVVHPAAETVLILSSQWVVTHWHLIEPVKLYRTVNMQCLGVHQSGNICWGAKDLCHKVIKSMIITALKSDPHEEIYDHKIIWQPVLLFQSLHYSWCRFFIFAETCAILQGLLSQEKLHQQ